MPAAAPVDQKPPRSTAANIDHRANKMTIEEFTRIVEGPADAAALGLLAECGIIAEYRHDGSWPLQETVDTLLRQDYGSRVSKAFDQHGGPEACDLDMPAAERFRLQEALDDIAIERLESSIVAAYLLGIAMGRRLTSPHLAPAAAGQSK